MTALDLHLCNVRETRHYNFIGADRRGQFHPWRSDSIRLASVAVHSAMYCSSGMSASDAWKSVLVARLPRSALTPTAPMAAVSCLLIPGGPVRYPVGQFGVKPVEQRCVRAVE